MKISNVGIYEGKQPHPLLVKVLLDTNFLEGNLAILVKILIIPTYPNNHYLWDCGIVKD